MVIPHPPIQIFSLSPYLVLLTFVLVKVMLSHFLYCEIVRRTANWCESLSENSLYCSLIPNSNVKMQHRTTISNYNIQLNHRTRILMSFAFIFFLNQYSILYMNENYYVTRFHDFSKPIKFYILSSTNSFHLHELFLPFLFIPCFR